MATVDDVIARLRLDTEQFSRALKGAEAQMGTATTGMGRNVDRLGMSFTALEKIVKGVMSSISAVVGGAVVVGLTKLVTVAANLGDELAKASDRTGISVEALSGLAVAAELADSNLSNVVTTVRFMNAAMVDAAQAPGDARDAFEELGISVGELARLSGRPAEALQTIAERLLQVRNSTNQSVIAQRLLGRSAQEQLPFLRALAQEGIGGLMEQARRYGRLITEDTARASEAFNDQLSGLKFQVQGLAVTIGGPLIRNLAALIDMWNVLTGVTQRSRESMVRTRMEAIEGLIGAAEEAKQQAGTGILSRLLGPQTMDPGEIEARRQELTALREELAALQRQATAPKPPAPSFTGDLPNKEAQARADAEAKAAMAERKRDEAELARLIEQTTEALEQQAQAMAARVSQAAAQADPLEQFRQTLVELQDLREAGLPVEQFGVLIGRAANEMARATPAFAEWLQLQEDGRQTIQNLLTPLGQYEQAIARLRAQLDAGAISAEQFERAQENLNQGLHETQQGLKDMSQASQDIEQFGLTFTSAFEEATIAGASFSDVMQGLVEDLQRVALRILIVEPLLRSLRELTRDLDWSEIGTAIIGGLGRIFTGGAGNATAVVKQQHGGMFSSPTLALIAEAGSPEVVMPQQRMESWMADMAARLGGSGFGGGVEINIINNASTVQVRQQSRETPQGGRQIDVLIDELVATQLQRPGSASRRTLGQVYNASPNLTGR